MTHSDPSVPQPPDGYQPTQPTPGAPRFDAPSPNSPRRLLTSKPVIGVAALVIGLAVGGAAGAGGKSDVAGAAPTVTVTATETATYEAPSEPSDEPSAEPSESASESPTASATQQPSKKSYKELSSRNFKLIAKDPDAYIGDTYVIYGEITQFDAATGTDTFRADTGPKKLRISYGYVDYDQNSMLNGEEGTLKKLVEGDCFKAKVTVLGSYSYDTQNGGNTTVPLFQVDSISVYGSTD